MFRASLTLKTLYVRLHKQSVDVAYSCKWEANPFAAKVAACAPTMLMRATGCVSRSGVFPAQSPPSRPAVLFRRLAGFLLRLVVVI